MQVCYSRPATQIWEKKAKETKDLSKKLQIGLNIYYKFLIFYKNS